MDPNEQYVCISNSDAHHSLVQMIDLQTERIVATLDNDEGEGNLLMCTNPVLGGLEQPGPPSECALPFGSVAIAGIVLQSASLQTVLTAILK